MRTGVRRFFGDSCLHLGVGGRVKKIPGSMWQKVGEHCWTTNYDWSHPPGSILRKYPDRKVSSELRSKIIRKGELAREKLMAIALEAEKLEAEAKKENQGVDEGKETPKKKKKNKKNKKNKRSAEAVEKM